MIRIAYICDRKRPCNMYGACGNECTHTFDEFHTANGIIHHVDELQTERFRKVCSVNEDTYYEEVDGWSNTTATDAEEEEILKEQVQAFIGIVKETRRKRNE